MNDDRTTISGPPSQPSPAARACGWPFPVAPVPICAERGHDRLDFFVKVDVGDISAEAVAEMMPEDCGALLLCPKCGALHAFFVDEFGPYEDAYQRAQRPGRDLAGPEVEVHHDPPAADKAIPWYEAELRAALSQDPREVDAAAVASALAGKSHEELAALLASAPADDLARALGALLRDADPWDRGAVLGVLYDHCYGPGTA